MTKIRTISIFSILVVVASCGAISDVVDALDFKDIADANFAIRSDFDDLPGTIPASLPKGGTASFDGAARVFIDPVLASTSDNILMYGDAEMIADFDAGTMTGSVTNLQGADGISASGANTFDVTGEIEIGGQNSSIGGVRDNDWSAEYAGDVTIPYGTYALSGQLDGQFVGTNPDAEIQVRGIYAEDNAGVAVLDGTDIPLFVAIGGPVVQP